MKNVFLFISPVLFSVLEIRLLVAVFINFFYQLRLPQQCLAPGSFEPFLGDFTGPGSYNPALQNWIFYKITKLSLKVMFLHIMNYYESTSCTNNKIVFQNLTFQHILCDLDLLFFRAQIDPGQIFLMLKKMTFKIDDIRA